ncbi:MAG: toll/interleukin-1 receptor domain-containing protein [Bryobacteraceae bacterium]|jgi:hypothetical protein
MDAPTFDVFLSYSKDDHAAVETLAKKLRKNGLAPWLDRWNLVPGVPWQPEIESALCGCRTCAVLVGRSAIGPWQNEEMRAAIQRRVANTQGQFRVIPVLLPGAMKNGKDSLPPFLITATWVEFSDGLGDRDAFHRLVAGIRGLPPGVRRQRGHLQTEWVLVLSAKVDDVTKPVAEAILEHLRTLSGDATLTIKQITRGSVRITLRGSAEGLEQLQILTQSGRLTSVLGMEVLEILPAEPSTSLPSNPAKALLTELLALGCTIKEVAERVRTRPARISRLLSDLGHPVPDALVRSLRDLLEEVRMKRAIAQFPLTVLEFCHEPGVVVDEYLRSRMRSAINDALSGPHDKPISLPPGVNGVLARLGSPSAGTYLFFITETASDDHRRVLLHELDHLRHRLAHDIRSPIRERPEPEY